jgi:long-chain acyl-CoA synthetase
MNRNDGGAETAWNRKSVPKARTAQPAKPASTTVPGMFWDRVQRWPDRIVFREKKQGAWASVTWQQAGEIVRALTCGLVARGFNAGETASILANTRSEWCYADLGLLSAGGVSIGIYPTVPPVQVETLLNDSRSCVVFVEDEEQLDKVLAVRQNTPALRQIVVFDTAGLRNFDDPMVISLDQLLEQGRRQGNHQAGILEQRLLSRQADDLAIVVYTSGTTGAARGAMISHKNLMTQMVEGVPVVGQDEHDERLAFLPLCHAAERVLGCYYALFAGTVTSFVEKPETLVENACEVAPTIFMGVPRIWQKLYSSVMLRLSDATAFQRWAYDLAIGVGYKRSQLGLLHRPVPVWLRVLDRLAYVLVLRTIRQAIGIDRCRMLITGAAPISPELIRWYLALGVDMLEVYGQTECSGLISFMPAGRIKPGTVGKPMPFIETSLSSQGEVLVRGASVFMGYLNTPRESTEVDALQWQHTGDIGAFDSDGYLTITGRIKDILITAGGKNVTPSVIENELKFSRYVADAVVIGDARKFLTCLVMLDHDNVSHFAQEHDVPFTDFVDLCRSAAVQKLIWHEIEAVNQKLSRVETIKKFRLIEKKLTAEDREMTPTLKIKRAVVIAEYADAIEEMYQEQ